MSDPTIGERLEGADGASSSPKRRGRKPGRPSAAGARRTGKRGPRGSKLDPFRSVIGTIPDRDVAARAGMSIEAVRLYHKKNKIELQPGARLKRGRKPKSATAGAVVAPKQGRQKRVSPRAASPDGPRRRISKLDPYRELLGKVSDREVAAKAGVTPENVRAYRRRHNIEATWREDGEATTPQPQHRRGRPAGSTSRLTAGAGRKSSGQHGYAIHVVVGTNTHEYLVIAPDIATAAGSARATVRARHPKGEITAIRHLGPALT